MVSRPGTTDYTIEFLANPPRFPYNGLQTNSTNVPALWAFDNVMNQRKAHGQTKDPICLLRLR